MNNSNNPDFFKTNNFLDLKVFMNSNKGIPREKYYFRKRKNETFERN
jgi:hypothetical protein